MMVAFWFPVTFFILAMHSQYQQINEVITMRRIITIMFAMMIALLAGVSAFEIEAPQEGTYDSSEIQLRIAHNETLDSISYAVGTVNETIVCENCSEYEETLNLTEGSYTIMATGALANTTFTDSVNFSVDFPDPEDFSIVIQDPENKTYNESLVEIEIQANATLDMIELKINEGNYSVMCENCSEYNADINLSNGNYTVSVRGTLGDVYHEESVDFVVEVPEEEPETEIDLEIVSPESEEYDNESVDFEVKTELESNITYVLNGIYASACDNCTEYSETWNLSEGNYSLTVYAYSEDMYDMKSVDFTVVYPVPSNDTNETDDDDDDTDSDGGDGESRFDKGFEKLPKAVENAELTDDELAEIIRNNKLNHGVINRLIKTGMLGNESLNAIMETQFNPPGIFRKIMSWLGFQQTTYGTLIYETYDLTEDQEEKIVTRDDLPKKYAEEVKEKIRKRTEAKVSNKGQEKKIQAEVQTATNNGRPVLEYQNGALKVKGQSEDKKTFNAGKQNGNTKDKSNNGKANGKKK